MKLCKDCKHFDGNMACAVAVRLNEKPDIVSGVMDCGDGEWRARDQRRKQDACGVDAAWFEPKPPSMLSRFLNSLRRNASAASADSSNEGEGRPS